MINDAHSAEDTTGAPGGTLSASRRQAAPTPTDAPSKPSLISLAVINRNLPAVSWRQRRVASHARIAVPAGAAVAAVMH